MPKYVASRTLTDTTWNAKLLEGDVADGEPSTEDLRSALQKYRAFFQRLLTI